MRLPASAAIPPIVLLDAHLVDQDAARQVAERQGPREVGADLIPGDDVAIRPGDLDTEPADDLIPVDVAGDHVPLVANSRSASRVDPDPVA